MVIRRRVVAIVCASVAFALLVLTVVLIGLSVRQQHATVKAIEASGGRISSFWLPGESGLRPTNWFLTPSWYLNRFVAQPRGVILDEETNVGVISALKKLPTVERILLMSQDLSSPRTKDIIHGLQALPNVRNLAFFDCKNLLSAQQEFDALKHIEALSIMRPPGDGYASLSIVESWPQLRTLCLTEATICKNALTYPTATLADLRFAACRFEPGEFKNLGRFSKLRRLSLYKTEILDFNINVLGSLRELQELELSTARVDEADVRHLINEVPSLRELVLPFDWSEERISVMRPEFPGVAIWRCEEAISKSFSDRPPIDKEGNTRSQ